MFSWIKRRTQDKRAKQFYKVIVEDLEECEPKYDVDFVKDQYGIKAPFDVPRNNFMAYKLRDNVPEISGIIRLL